MRLRLVLVLGMMTWLSGLQSGAAEWQWSTPDGEGRAYLWVPPTCARVRAVVVANHNMIEQGILEHPVMRRTLSDIGFAEVWIVPGMGVKFDFNAGDEQRFERIVKALADMSGYDEIASAPVVPLGHSANATWVWNFAAWNPGRTLAILSVHGDAPQTTLTGYGRANVDWGDRNINGVPGLMVMGEYEWWEDRLAPALQFRKRHPDAPLAFLCDAGQGHFNACDELVNFLAMFIRKAAATRLAADGALKPVEAYDGWLLERWRPDQSGGKLATPYAAYAGNVAEAFWCFDEEMAHAEQSYYATTCGKRPQLLTIDGKCGEPVTPHLELLADGLNFRLQTGFADVVPNEGHAKGWTKLPAGSPLGHGAGDIALHWIVGPAVQTAPDTFRIRFGRGEYTADRRNNEIWIYASHPGDEKYKSMVQQAQLHVPVFGGQDQHITFPGIPDQLVGTHALKLNATSDAGLPVQYYVREGPAEVEGDTLRFTPSPPRSRLPIEVTVVAWQPGRGTEPQIQRALPVERTFHIVQELW